jgi:hypothetical protein
VAGHALDEWKLGSLFSLEMEDKASCGDDNGVFWLRPPSLLLYNERGEATSQLNKQTENHLMCNQVVAATEATNEALSCSRYWRQTHQHE